MIAQRVLHGHFLGLLSLLVALEGCDFARGEQAQGWKSSRGEDGGAVSRSRVNAEFDAAVVPDQRANSDKLLNAIHKKQLERTDDLGMLASFPYGLQTKKQCHRSCPQTASCLPHVGYFVCHHYCEHHADCGPQMKCLFGFVSNFGSVQNRCIDARVKI
jgi:hypothetical protein